MASGSPKFLGQLAVITGGGQGIGNGVARRLARNGADVVLVDVNADLLTKAKAEFEAYVTTLPTDCHGVKVHVSAIDVTNEEQVAGLFAGLSRVDIVVNCAGVTGKTNIKTHEVSLDNFNFVFNVNVNGTFLMCKHALPKMVQANYGRLINIASISGKDGNAGMLAYSASKSAVIGLTKVIGKDYAETGITCNAIAPAVVRTAMVDALPEEQVKYMTDKIPMKRCGTIEEIAGLVEFIASADCTFSTGFCFDASGGRAVY